MTFVLPSKPEKAELQAFLTGNCSLLSMRPCLISCLMMWGRLAEYFQQLYQGDPPKVNLVLGIVEIPVPDPPFSED